MRHFPSDVISAVLKSLKDYSIVFEYRQLTDNEDRLKEIVNIERRYDKKIEEITSKCIGCLPSNVTCGFQKIIVDFSIEECAAQKNTYVVRFRYKL